MKYLLLIYGNEGTWAGMSPAEQEKAFGEYMTYTNEIKREGHYLGGEALQPVSTATTDRYKNGKPITTDGVAPGRARSRR